MSFNETQEVEGILRNQIIEAVDEEFLMALRNPTTNMIH